MTAGSKELRRGEGKRCSWTLLLSFRSFPPRNEETGSKDSPKSGGGKQPKSCFFTFRAKTIGHKLSVQWPRLFGERRQSAKALPEGPKKGKKNLFLPSFSSFACIPRRLRQHSSSADHRKERRRKRERGGPGRPPFFLLPLTLMGDPVVALQPCKTRRKEGLPQLSISVPDKDEKDLACLPGNDRRRPEH